MTVKETIKRTIKRVSKEQINLQSQASIEMLSEKIALELAGKFYCVPYSSQKNFEE